MTAHPIVIVDDGKVEIPAEFQSDPRFQNGAILELVPVTPDEISAESKGDWRRLDGIFADEAFDTTEWKQREREWELAHDERKFGTKRPTW